MTGLSAETAERPRRAKRAKGRPGPKTMFFRSFLKNPVMVGSIIPSSRQCIDHMLSKVDWANCRLFVEYGPGVGTFTRPVLERMGPDATLLAIDTNADFISYLRDDIDDPRLRLAHGSAADVGALVAELGHEKADYVLSGLPFSTLPPGVGDAIARATAEVLRPGGAFLVYQFSPKVRDFLAPNFPRIEHGFELVNIPPCQLYWAWKD